jgi:hypothetical protein
MSVVIEDTTEYEEEGIAIHKLSMNSLVIFDDCREEDQYHILVVKIGA